MRIKRPNPGDVYQSPDGLLVYLVVGIDLQTADRIREHDYNIKFATEQEVQQGAKVGWMSCVLFEELVRKHTLIRLERPTE